ncbi:hypothetical protein [Streptomyces sp. NPDC050546]|uniref:hypothetical protein n=1 Tax=Streptomyces sp. NPDC050546 TaxID=3365628 RepID=UPI00379E5836
MSHLVDRSLRRGIRATATAAVTAAIVGGFGISTGSPAVAADATSAGSGTQVQQASPEAKQAARLRIALASGAGEAVLEFTGMTGRQLTFVRGSSRNPEVTNWVRGRTNPTSVTTTVRDASGRVVRAIRYTIPQVIRIENAGSRQSVTFRYSSSTVVG